MFFTSPSSFRTANSKPSEFIPYAASSYPNGAFAILPENVHTSATHAPLGHLILLVFEAVMEVVCVSLPGYIVARQGMFDAEMQKFVANLNVMLFTPCLIFTKLASQLTASKLVDLAVIPVIFVVQTLVSYLCSIAVSRAFGFAKRPRNFVVAMGASVQQVFGNSNSLPISLVISLAQTLKGLHWDRVPGDNDDEVAARGILYLLIFQQLGQLLRWSWGYHVLLAPPEKVEDDEDVDSQVEQGRSRYKDEPSSEYTQHLLEQSDNESEEGLGQASSSVSPTSTANGSSQQAQDERLSQSRAESEFASGGQTPVTRREYTSSVSSKKSFARGQECSDSPAVAFPTPLNGNIGPNDGAAEHMVSFPSIRSPTPRNEGDPPAGLRGHIQHYLSACQAHLAKAGSKVVDFSSGLFQRLPLPLQHFFEVICNGFRRFMHGLWEFMNPPLWAMLAAIIVASIPALQRVFFTDGTFIQNSVSRAVSQSGQVAVPLILVVLGANLARNTLPQDPHASIDKDKVETKLLIACIVSRMLLPTIIMAPMLALAAKYIPISILDDPIFVIVCFLLTGAPSALQLAQICQINGVYEGVMSKLLFQSYVIWILPSTLILVMCALEVVQWANDI
ncbi:MAG: hypothetical protein M1817_001014 [Caeruleum heppii]|nr:MAG: hypothetical protein M1817_001014 [Caeruleum heppii]